MKFDRARDDAQPARRLPLCPAFRQQCQRLKLPRGQQEPLCRPQQEGGNF